MIMCGVLKGLSVLNYWVIIYLIKQTIKQEYYKTLNFISAT